MTPANMVHSIKKRQSIAIMVLFSLVGCVKQDQSLVLTENIKTTVSAYRTSSRTGTCYVTFSDQQVTPSQKVFLEEDAIIVCNGQGAEQRHDGYYADFEYNNSGYIEVMIIRPEEGTTSVKSYPVSN